jgi:hypothetical protein
LQALQTGPLFLTVVTTFDSETNTTSYGYTFYTPTQEAWSGNTSFTAPPNQANPPRANYLSLLSGKHILLTICQSHQIQHGHTPIYHGSKNILKTLQKHTYKHMSHALYPEADLLYILYNNIKELRKYVTVTLKHITRPTKLRTS